MNVVCLESGVESGGEGRIVAATDHRAAPAELVVDRPGELMVNRVAHRAGTMR
jgi:hypothetical protein